MLQIISINDTKKWDDTVKSFKEHDIYYFSGYVAALQKHGDGTPILFFYEDANIRAMDVVMKRDIAYDKNFLGKLNPNAYYDLSTPYGYGGFLIEGSNVEAGIEQLNQQYINYCKVNNIISEIVRFHPVIDNVSMIRSMYDVLPIGKTITVELNSLEEIWDNLKGKNKNVIRKAIKNEVKISWGLDQQLIDTFIPLYNSTMDRDNATDYYYFKEEYYSCYLNELSENTLIFSASYEDKIIAMSIILLANDQIHYHLSASDSQYRSLAPTNLLLLEVANWGCKNGYKTLHLGGGLGGKEDNLYKFKEAFNKNSKTSFSIGKKIFNEEVYNKLVDIKFRDSEIMEKTNFFPKYRA